MHSRLTFIVTGLTFLSLHLTAQDMMYRSNGGKIPVQVINRTNQYVSYKLAGGGNFNLYYISTSVIDSIVFGNGNKELYTLHRKTETDTENIKISDYGRSLIGLDIASLVFYKSLSLSYEYFVLNRSLGIKALIGIDLSDHEYWDNVRPIYVYRKEQIARIGANWYFFPPGSFRVGSGVYFLAGNYNIHGVQTIYNTEPPYDASIQNVEENRKFSHFGLTVFVFYHITRNLAINAGIDFPNQSPGQNNSVFRSEILINF
jgi:hypothetical protein